MRTDASIYQIEPVGVLVPRTIDDVAAAIAIAREHGVPVLPRGGGTCQCGQTVGAALVIDCSKYLRRVLESTPAARTAWVEPGLVLDHLNARLQAARPVVPGRPLDRTPRCTHRRHGRQQLLRLASHPLRQHGAQRARDRRHRWPTAAASRSARVPRQSRRRRAGRDRRVRPAAARARRAPSATRSRARLPAASCAASAATTSTC